MELREFKIELKARGKVYAKAFRKDKVIRLTPDDLKVGRKYVTWNDRQFRLLNDMTLRCGCKSYKLYWTAEEA